MRPVITFALLAVSTGAAIGLRLTPESDDLARFDGDILASEGLESLVGDAVDDAVAESDISTNNDAEEEEEDNGDNEDDEDDNDDDDDNEDDDDDDDDEDEGDLEDAVDHADAADAQAAVQIAASAERRRKRRRRRRGRKGKKGPLQQSAESMVNGLLNGNMVRGYGGSMGLVRALGGPAAPAMNARTMMLGGLTNGLSPGLPNLKKLSNAQLRAHMDALTAAFQQMQLISACHHTYNALGLGQGVAAALQGGLPNVAGMGTAGPSSMVHPALNPLNPNSPLNPFLAHHMALSQAGALFHQLTQAQKNALAPPTAARAPIVVQPLQGASNNNNQGPMHTFSVGAPALMQGGQQAPVTHHVYHYNAPMGAAGMPAMGAAPAFMQHAAAINHAGYLAAGMTAGY